MRKHARSAQCTPEGREEERSEKRDSEVMGREIW